MRIRIQEGKADQQFKKIKKLLGLNKWMFYLEGSWPLLEFEAFHFYTYEKK
jgi:hypothetical protein